MRGNTCTGCALQSAAAGFFPDETVFKIARFLTELRDSRCLALWRSSANVRLSAVPMRAWQIWGRGLPRCARNNVGLDMPVGCANYRMFLLN